MQKVLQKNTKYLLLLFCFSIAPAKYKKNAICFNTIHADLGCKIRPHKNKDSLNYTEGLVGFMFQLQEIVKEKNFKKLVNVVAQDVTVSYGEAIYGKSKFKEYWRDINNQELLWEILQRMLTLGGDNYKYQNQNAFIFPYLKNERFYYGVKKEWFNLAVITDSAVPLYDDSNHKLLESLSYDIVEITDHSESGLSKISTICGNKKGWVQDDKLYTCIDYTMILLKDKNKIWKIKVLSTD